MKYAEKKKKKGGGGDRNVAKGVRVQELFEFLPYLPYEVRLKKTILYEAIGLPIAPPPRWKFTTMSVT